MNTPSDQSTSALQGAAPPPQQNCACSNCGTVFCGAQNSGMLNGVSLTHLIGITVLVISVAIFLGCARACFLNLRFRHIARTASGLPGRDSEAGARRAAPPVPVALARPSPKEPQPLRVLIINPDDEERRKSLQGAESSRLAARVSLRPPT
ncbi:hypothetical protein WJX81_004908 [Elliptochloris bilobata]|uniref:Uncharacterized protein n=1 Tax=Elliptochloris bilobata TaxID=381761 RepID=A0AAW1SCB5_9CHLO